ncbi:glycosyltransferase family 2 protein [Altererythrobacter arenosus]|uniref:Glycosyltransferase family 2 protein n=1 Tax=Altererythrobacter arenosus TaxID=3032592 RepID=A0ABY8FNK3_9SPHN|nr:glycosyltransferase family 2 protein [Altererythrobacter sp. CAU 1644]WFL76602.1 glycosyltransferase family 2 protein [Altererythrobacter sp. CAU 1644]
MDMTRSPDPSGAESTQQLELAIILPTLNERGNLAPLVERIEDALGSGGWEVLIVDDNSADGTADEARRIALTDGRVRVIQRIGRRGLASAAIEGFCATAAPFCAVMDADHQHDPALLPLMLNALKAGEGDIAVASRFAEGASMEGWGRPDREKLSGAANALARKLTGVELTDPMSGYFMLPSETARALVPKLSGIGFKILLDLLASAERPMKVREFPLNFSARREGESKLDRAIAFDFLAGLYDKTFGKLIPTRFALFGTVGAMGVIVHMAVLSLVLFWFDKAFTVGQAVAVLSAMSFNFWLNNWLTYRDQRLKGTAAVLKGWVGFCLTCAVGGFANVAVATLLESRGLYWVIAALAGIVVGSVWNYALSSRFVWGRY